ncbi:MAG: BMP family ABC transporter substrate-binding protein [Flexilinea sp.]|nr:BMP family ABC transporter substrate-binding protein [Flexilinea sp.]
MKRYYLVTFLICFAVLTAFSFIYNIWEEKVTLDLVRVGFLSENDEMTVNTNNFIQSRNTLEKEFQEHVEIFTKANVGNDQTEEALMELVHSGCNIIFANTRSNAVRVAARNNPDVQFCQISNAVAVNSKGGDNFHTFNARSFEAHYAGGVVAGLKLRELIDSGVITADEALVGYVGSYQTAEVISGFTSFYLGVHSVVPEALMRVRFSQALSNFLVEKNIAKELIDEGCVIIAQNSGTTGPAAACQDAAGKKTVFHVGFNQNMIDIAPSVSLVSPRINWDPYISGAVQAVMNNMPIEEVVSGNVNGNDVWAGFDQGWLEMLELNDNVVSKGTVTEVNRVIEAIKKGQIEVFKGSFIGENPDDPRIVTDLRWGYPENRSSSKPNFHYLLRDLITVEN